MFQNLASIFLVLGGIAAAYYLTLLIVYRKKQSALFMKGEGFVALASPAVSDFPHQLIDRPGIGNDTSLIISLDKNVLEDEVELEMEMVEDEESLLLKAAEVVVEKVQNVVTHIASNPPNPEEVYTKIKAVVSPYTIFHNTEYFDAINSFIALTVERDCAIRYSKDELLSLWN
ncbi:MAG: hypothetical protein WCF67_08030 [Chitinophagaceae bacterium]